MLLEGLGTECGWEDAGDGGCGSGEGSWEERRGDAG